MLTTAERTYAPAAPAPSRVGSVGLTAAAIALLPLLTPAGPGNVSPVDVLIVLAIGTSFLWLLWSRRPALVPYALGGGLMLFAGAVAALHGDHPRFGLLTLAQDVLVLAWAVAVANVASQPGVARRLLRVWVVAAATWAGLVVVGFIVGAAAITGVTAHEGARVSGRFGDPNLAASYFVTSILLTLALGWPQRPLVRWSMVAVLVVALALTGSNGGLLALLVGLTVGGAIELYRRAGLVAVVVTAVVVGSVLGLASQFVSVSDLQQRARELSPTSRDSIGRSDQSVSTRSELLHEVLDLYRHGSLIGSGPGTTKQLLIEEGAPYAKEAHNDYTATLAERGVAGALGLLVLMVSVGLRAVAIGRSDAPRAVRDLVPGPGWLIGALAAVVMSAAFYEMLHVRHLWALLGILAALASETIAEPDGAVR